MLFCDHVVSLEEFNTLASGDSEFYLKIKGYLLIWRDEPELNRTEKSLAFYLFGKCIPTRMLYLFKVLV